MKRSTYLAALAVLLAICPDTRSQTAAATIVGTVTDASGAVVASAAVRVVRLESGLERRVLSGSRGEFTVSDLPVGSYQVTATAAGFRTTLRSGIRLAVGGRVHVDLALAVGPLDQLVTVTGDAPIAQAGTSSLGTVIDADFVRGLPLNGRDFLQLGLLSPGAAPPAPGSELSTQSASGLHFTGAREASNNFLLDGGDNNDAFINRIVVSPSVELVQEFRVQAVGYGAELGRSGGAQVLVVTRRGENRLHGSVYHFLRNARLDARNLFDPADQPIPQLQRNQFGVFASGPLRRDRAFLAAGYEGTRLRQGVTRTARVPTAAEKRGDFSAHARPLLDPVTRQAFPDNRVPADRLDPIGVKIAGLFPDPNRADPNANYVASPVGRSGLDQGNARLDVQLTPADSLTLRASTAREDSLDPYNEGVTNLPGFGSVIVGRAQNVVLSGTHAFGSSALGELRLGFNRLRRELLPENSRPEVVASLGIAGLSRDPVDAGMPAVAVSGYDRLADNTAFPIVRHDSTLHVAPSVVWSRPAWTLRAGSEVRHVQVNGFNHVFARGQFTFQPAATGFALADLLLGLPSVALRGSNDNPQALRATAYDAFVQFDRRLGRGLTVNLGLRYELNRPPVDKHDRMAVFDVARGRVVGVGQGGTPRGGIDVDGNNLAPRVGLAWSSGRDARTTLRAAYGVFHDVGTLVTTSALYFNPPHFELAVFVPSATRPLTLSGAFSTPGFAPPPTLTTLAPDFPTAYIQNWHASVERELGRDTLARVSYVGARGTRLVRRRNLNQPAPGAGTVAARRGLRAYADITVIEPTANSAYHALQASLERRLARGVQILAGYTAARSIDDTSDFLAVNGDDNYPQDSGRLHLERGVSNFDLRNRFTITGLVELPRAGRLGRTAFLARALDGWQAGAIAVVQSGFPFTPRLGRDNSNTGNVGGILGWDRPHRIADGRVANPTADRMFDTRAFEVGSPYTFGNSGRNVLSGRGLRNIDLSLRRRFALAGERAVEFRTEAFNVFNTPPLALPERVADEPATFGKVLSAGPARQIQFALRLLF